MSQHGQILQKKGRLWISMNLNIQVAIFAKCFFIFCHLFQFRRWVFYPAFPVPLGSSLCHVERNIKNIFCMSVTSHDSQVQVSLPELCLILRCFQVFADLIVSKGIRTLKVQSCTSTGEVGVYVIGGSKETDGPTSRGGSLGNVNRPEGQACRMWGRAIHEMLQETEGCGGSPPHRPLSVLGAQTIEGYSIHDVSRSFGLPSCHEW